MKLKWKMKEFDKKFADTYIEEQLQEEKEKEKVVFYENMDSGQQMMYDIIHKRKGHYEHSELVKFFLKLNWFEKLMFVVAQLVACVIPFTMLASFGKTINATKMGTISITLWIICAVCLLSLGLSRKIRKGEKFSISFIPKFK